jgi:hypothetical protein
MVRKEHYTIAFLLTTLLFIVGILVGWQITNMNTQNVQQQLQMDIVQTQSFELELSLLDRAETKDICKYIETRMPEIMKSKVELGRRFDTGDIPDDQAETLQAQFATSLVRFYLFSQLQEEKCHINKPTVLFFFDKSEASREQGLVLDNIVYQMSNENITVFSFGKNLAEKQPIIELLYKLNNITTEPALIINNTKYEGFQTREQITAIICKDYNLSIC